MIKFYSGYIGICFFLIGVLTLFLYSEIPEELNWSIWYSIILTILGVALIYYGREQLPSSLGYFFSNDSNEDND